jgi:hypothetical protein
LYVYGGYIYIYNFAHILYLFHILIGLERHIRFGFAAYCSLRIKIPFHNVICN